MSFGERRGWSVARKLIPLEGYEKVNYGFIADHRGIYRNNGSGFDYMPSEKFWVMVAYDGKSKGPRRRQLYVDFSDHPDLGLAAAFCNVAVLSPQLKDGRRILVRDCSPLGVLDSLPLLRDSCFVDYVDFCRMRWDPSYPAGPSPDSLLDELESDLVDVRPPRGHTDDDLYRFFTTNVHNNLVSIFTASRLGQGHTMKVGAANFRDLRSALRVRARGRCGRHDWEDDLDTEFTIAVGILPKIGHLTSKGKIRRIFPMSIGLQRTLELLMGDANSRQSYPFATVVHGPKFPELEHTYDVNGCDRVMYDYVHRFTEDKPLLREALLPPVYTRLGVKYAPQFPSGLLCTTLVVQCFTAALLQQLGVHGYIQGDGIMTAEPIQHPLLRKCPPYVINGFSYKNGVKYVNGREKLCSPRLLTRTWAPDNWSIRRAIYIKILHADAAELPPDVCTFDYAALTPADLGRIASQRGICLRLLRYSGHHVPNDNSWDAVTTATRCIPGQRPLLKPRLLADGILSELNC